jgi:fucose 4-O-acetylase-like acetyltransferase
MINLPYTDNKGLPVSAGTNTVMEESPSEVSVGRNPLKSPWKRFCNYFFNAAHILESKRLAWIDYAKGLTIILVVYHHCYLTLINSGVQVSSWMINANLFVYSFRMPMFFMLSGLFIAKSLQKRGAKKYIENRARILLYPYLLWAFLQATAGIVFNQYAHATWNLERYLVIFYQPNATSQLWYLITLFNTALLYVLLQSIFHLNNRWQFVLGIILYLVSPFLMFNSMLQDTTRFYVYLVFGSIISDFILSKDNFKLFSSVKLLIPLALLGLISQYYLFKHLHLYQLEMSIDMKGLTLQHVLLHFWGMLRFTTIVMIGCAFALSACTIFERFGKAVFVRVLGYHSLYIYLMHVLIAVGLRIVFVDLLHYTNAYILLPLLIIVGMIGSTMIYNLCKHIGLGCLFEYDPALTGKLLKRIRFKAKFQDR